MTTAADATKERLMIAARQLFAEKGCGATTVRDIAARAGVNASLINRYFGGKDGLFAQAVSVDLALPDMSGVSPDQIGSALVEHFFQRWEGDETDDLLRVLVRSAATEPAAAERLRRIIVEQLTPTVAALTGDQNAPQRAALVATQMLGLAFYRYVLAQNDEGLPRTVAVREIGETLNRYILAGRGDEALPGAAVTA